MELTAAWLALAGTIFGGAGFKIIEHWLGKNTKRDDTASKMRDELRTEVITLRQQYKEVQSELESSKDEIDEWRNKYYELVGTIAKGDLAAAMASLKKIAEEDNVK